MKNEKRRRIVAQLGTIGLILPVLAHGKGFFSMNKAIVIDVVVFNYLNRPIWDVYLNGEMVGGSASLPESPYGQFSTVAGVSVSDGPQKLTWIIDGSEGMPDNGKKITAKNAINVSIASLPKGTETLGVHIYPDYTAELIFSLDLVEQSQRGLTHVLIHKSAESVAKCA